VDGGGGDDGRDGEGFEGKEDSMLLSGASFVTRCGWKDLG
jgi:hypothetical protein